MYEGIVTRSFSLASPAPSWQSPPPCAPAQAGTRRTVPAVPAVPGSGRLLHPAAFGWPSTPTHRPPLPAGSGPDAYALAPLHPLHSPGSRYQARAVGAGRAGGGLRGRQRASITERQLHLIVPA